jgi:hypothetical protein
LLYEANQKGFWTWVRLPPGPPKGDCMPVDMYYYTEGEWNRLGCGPLPLERDIRNKVKSSFEGPDMVSTGSRVGEWTTRQAIDVNEAK